MNKLPLQTRVQILSMLCEGSSMRSIARVCDVSINTVTKLLIDAGEACDAFHDDTVRNVASKRIQCDEIWSFTYAKHKNLRHAKAAPIGSGDVWTWTAIDADSKLIVSWYVGDRDTSAATTFMSDLKGRLANRVQLTTDGHKPYLAAIASVFNSDVDYGILQKVYGSDPQPEKRYSPAKLISVDKDLVLGSPAIEHVSTSYVERQNLTMRMSMRRFTRLTNAFSKKVENHYHALSLYFVWYNFMKAHKSLKGATPAMASGLVSDPMSMADIVALIDLREVPAKKRGPYKKRPTSEENSN